MRQLHASGIALGSIAVEGEALALDQFRAPAGEAPDAELGPLQVGQNGDGAADPGLQRPDAPITATFPAWSPWLMLMRNASAPAR
jgi:hypothetical protein